MTQGFPPRICSRAVVLRMENVDTDVITPIGRVVQGREAVVRFAFEPLRFSAEGVPLVAHPFNDPERKDAEILIAGRNFGCGSSRETAAWAIRGLGFQVIVAPSYGDIFYSNCLKNGVLPVRLSAEDVESLMLAADELADLEINLPDQQLICRGRAYVFEIGALPKEMLLSGLDELGLIQAQGAAQAEYERCDSQARPWVRNRHAPAKT